MSFDDDQTDSFVPPDDDETPSFGSFGSAAPRSPQASQVRVNSEPAVSWLRGWRGILKKDSEESKCVVNGKTLSAHATFDLPHDAPACILAKVDMHVQMIFGSSLHSRLRGLWDDSNFMAKFCIVSAPDSPLGIGIGSAEHGCPGFPAVPEISFGDGVRTVSSCISQGALQAITQRVMQSALVSWHQTHFYTAQECRAAAPAPQASAILILQNALDRPCRVSKLSADTGYLTTHGDEGFLWISDDDIIDGSGDYHVRITVQHGCIAAIDIDGATLNPVRERALNAARARLGLKAGPLPISDRYAAAIVDLIMSTLVAKDAEATPNLFSYIAAHVAMSLKHSLGSFDCKEGLELLRPSVMPFVPYTDASLYSLDHGMCGLMLQDALCCMQREVISMVFKSAAAASKQIVASRSGSSKQWDVCEPWPDFLLKKIGLNVFRGGVVDDAAARANADAGRQGLAAKAQSGAVAAVLGAGLGSDNKMKDEWQSSMAAALHALDDGCLIDMMTNARTGSPTLEQRKAVLQRFLSSSGVADADRLMFEKVCGFVLRTLPFLPLLLPSSFPGSLVWFGDVTPWEDGLEQDIKVVVKDGSSPATQFFYHGTKGHCVYSIMRNNLQNLSNTELMGVGAAYDVGLYFSQQLGTASGYSQPAHDFEVAPMFIMEAAGQLQTYVKDSPTICTSLLPKALHDDCLKKTGRRTPHAKPVIRGLMLRQGDSGIPPMSTDNRRFFANAQAAYAAAVCGGGVQADVQSLGQALAPSSGFKCSAAHP